jgi:hypothetical protein
MFWRIKISLSYLSLKIKDHKILRSSKSTSQKVFEGYQITETFHLGSSVWWVTFYQSYKLSAN